MSAIPWRACALAALLPLSAAVNAADPTNAATSVPDAQYESAFRTYRAAVDESTGPDKQWRAANDAVATKPGEDDMDGMHMGGSMTTPVRADMAAPKPSGKTMGMPNGTAMPRDHHQNIPMDKGLQIPTDKGVKVPSDKGIKTPGNGTVPRTKDMTIPMPTDHRHMPNMDMPPGGDGKGH